MDHQHHCHNHNSILEPPIFAIHNQNDYQHYLKNTDCETLCSTSTSTSSLSNMDLSVKNYFCSSRDLNSIQRTTTHRHCSSSSISYPSEPPHTNDLKFMDESTSSSSSSSICDSVMIFDGMFYIFLCNENNM